MLSAVDRCRRQSTTTAAFFLVDSRQPFSSCPYFSYNRTFFEAIPWRAYILTKCFFPMWSFHNKISSLQHNSMRSFCLVLVFWNILQLLSIFYFFFVTSSRYKEKTSLRMDHLLLFLSLTQCSFVSNTYNDDVTE